MDKGKDTRPEKDSSLEKQKKGTAKDNIIVAVFKTLLGFNSLKMGTKKDF